jgi:digeranylgeranylglycerophospholipid reductase
MVVGDAAHQVNAIHGGGVGEAMRSGILAGNVAAKAVEAQDYSSEFLGQYEQEWLSTDGKRLGKLVKLRQVVEALSDKDLDFLADQLKGDDIIELAKANKYKMLAKILAKRPSLMRLIPKLI